MTRNTFKAKKTTSRRPVRTATKSAPVLPWLVAVRMGLGHQRAAYPLRGIARRADIIPADDHPNIPPEDKSRWYRGRILYESVSRLSRIPYVGEFIFGIFDLFQRIGNFYPKRLSPSPTLQLAQTYRMIADGWGRHFIRMLAAEPSPLISTFFTPAFMAEEFNYPGSLWCVACDADVSRAWAPIEPAKSRIRYFAPTHHVADRLMRYGVPHDHIVVTGFPLPIENLGSEKYEVAKRDLAGRLSNLDPSGTYRERYSEVVKKHLGRIPRAPDHPLTVLFAVGGAGAQVDIACDAITGLRTRILAGKLRFIVSAGTNPGILPIVRERLDDPKLAARIGFIAHPNVNIYFEHFNQALHATDILWTKPSELSFYAALGIPILIAPPLGSHEEWNRDWLLETGAGILQNDARYADEWLSDFLSAGRFAEAAMQGFVEIEKGGVFAITRIIQSEKTDSRHRS